ncbi:MAG: hypothetical protein HFJ83_03470 [Muribaculaceae bacterium]|jgi:endonuclease I|nr:hypothetical protein [Muribaculaceae bacterium]
MKMRKIFTMGLAAVLAATAYAAEPSGYYDSCKGKGGKSLLTALHDKIGSHTNVGYDGLWNVYKTSDVHADGSLWDMYSTKNWGKNFKKCGNYSGVGSCVNREHSLPKSWWGGGSQTQYSDAYHLYPTDGQVNGQRSNYPFGECANGTTLKGNGCVGLGRLGTSTFPGYRGTVFEPDDEYKGDFARTYFYMAACYNDKISSWTSGEGGKVMAGNNYPVFKTWVVELLMKWHRQDPVSEKETDRNDAVYAHQRNRNPFIDHPELADYIWGDKKDQSWNGEAVADGSFTLPVDGSTLDMGTAGTGVPVSAKLTVKGKDLTGDVSVSATNGLQLSTTSISAAQANAGTEITLTWKFSKAGNYTSKLTLTSGGAKSEVTVKAAVADGLPATAATQVTTNSFRANWTYVGDDTNGRYTLDVRQGNVSIDGYPRDVDAATGHYTVDGLDESTTYTYTLASATMTSNTVSVTTGAPIPSVEFLYDGDLRFAGEAGTPTAAEEILVIIENISTAVSVSVKAPFEISTDRTTWGTTLSMQPDEDRMYMRLNADREGTFATEISARAGDYETESGTVTGTAVDPDAEFVETFEANFAKTYTDGPYEGSAARWMFKNIGVVGVASQGDKIYDGEKACRFGKDAGAFIEMAEDKIGGAGTVSFYACRWTNTQGTPDDAAVILVETSVDGGTTWQQAGSATVSATQYTKYSVPARVGGNVRVRLTRTEGKRINLDNVGITNYAQSGLNNPDDDYYSWDAFSPAAGVLCIESRNAAVADVHGVDGITYLNAAALSAGANSYELPAGLYIVVVDGESRRVLVK